MLSDVAWLDYMIHHGGSEVSGEYARMPVYKDKERGTWLVSFQRKDPITGKSKTTKKRGFATKREAVAAEKELLLSETKSSSVTFAEMVKLWEDASQASPLVRQKHREHFEKRFPYYNEPLESLTKPILSQWRGVLASDDKYSTTTKNLTVSYVKAVFRFAHQIYDLQDNASFLTRVRSTDEEAMKEFEVWTVEEFNTFIEHVDHPIYKAYFNFLYWTGCRRGEAIALQKADVHDHEAVIKYSQRLQSKGLQPTKKRNIRTIRIDDVLWSQLQPLLETEGSYVFGGISGLSPNAIDNVFRKAIAESGVKKIRLHDLRHSHATWLINNGVNIVAVSKRLGHKDISTTLNTYTHLLQATDNGMMDKINAEKHATIMPQKEKP